MAEKLLFCNLVGTDIIEKDPNTGKLEGQYLFSVFVDPSTCIPHCEGGQIKEKIAQGCPLCPNVARMRNPWIADTDQVIAQKLLTGECQPLTERAFEQIRIAFS